MEQVTTPKEQFRESDLSRKVVGVRFLPGSREFIRQVAQTQIYNNRLYEEAPGRWIPAQYGPLDSRLGISSKTGTCTTCGLGIVECVGHFGYIDLELPVFHIGFFRLMLQMLQCVCKSCSNLLLNDENRTSFLRQLQNPNLDYLRRKALHKRIVLACKKTPVCDRCGHKNGIVKKAVGAVLKVAHAAAISATDYNKFADQIRHSGGETGELASLIQRAKFDMLNAQQVHHILSNVNEEDIPFLMARADEGTALRHPIDTLLTRLAVPPVCIRPSVVSDVKSGTTEDDITMKLSEIMLINDVLRKHKRDGAPVKILVETWDHLQIQCALYINSEMSGLPVDLQPKKATRGFTQRLKGKQGRFRGNLSGKRVDFSGRTVISPDPNLKIDQVGVPIHVAKILTFPETVNAANIEVMRELVRNGDLNYPGATHIIEKKTGLKRFLRYGKRDEIAQRLHFGDVVERHMRDGDVVLFNRQPSLHKISIMSHRAKVMPGRTFRFNECACTPYNADFDGDEMNLHLPQTYEAKAEAFELMNVRHNLLTPRSGEPLIAAIQDFITGGYLLTHKDSFFPRSEVHRFVSALVDNGAKRQTRIRLPPPAILKPLPLWTGKQLTELLINPDTTSPIRLNLRCKNKSYTKNEEMCSNDSFVVIRNNVHLCGVLDKSLLGSSSKTSIFYVLLRDFGPSAAIEAMWRLARMAPVFLSNRGFSIGLGDVTPSEALLRDKRELLREGYDKCDTFIRQLQDGRLKSQPGCSPEETLEALVLRELSAIRDRAGQACLRNLSRHNAPLTMAVCGSKGSFINISQMIACVGQQAISGHRPPDGFEERSLPHFLRREKTPAAKGFVEDSFYSGLTPTEFFFHTMAGREGLVDTAVKTAETGYMQRRLVKCLEDLCCAYDNTVRTSTGEVVQFRFGNDGLDPVMMETGDGKLMDMTRVLHHIRAIHPLDMIAVVSPATLKASLPAVIEKYMPKSAAMGDYSAFAKGLGDFTTDYINSTARYYDLPVGCPDHKDALLSPLGSPTRAKRSRRMSISQTAACSACAKAAAYRRQLLSSHYFDSKQMEEFVRLCCFKLSCAVTEPGTAVGAIAATSIGEPSTQMTLKTFHFAGVASMNITQGVPRIKEIINSVRAISTPIITVALADENSEQLARRVKARIERTTLGEICEWVEEVYTSDDYFLLVKLSARRIRLLQLEITMESIGNALCAAKLLVPLKQKHISVRGKTIMVVRIPDSNKLGKTAAMQYLKHAIQSVVVRGIPTVSRCVIHADEKKGDSYSLLVEGVDMRAVCATPGVNGRKTRFNNALVVAEVLGIEAARTSIIEEILATMASHGIGLDSRHVMLLADLMTYKGEVLGITRNGLVRMKESVLLLASFEKTMDHLYEAAFYAQEDRLVGVSESIIMGAPVSLGTGLFRLLHRHEAVQLRRRQPIFAKKELGIQL